MMSTTPCDAQLTMSTIILVGLNVSSMVQMKCCPLSSPLLFISSSKGPTLGTTSTMRHQTPWPFYLALSRHELQTYFLPTPLDSSQ